MEFSVFIFFSIYFSINQLAIPSQLDSDSNLLKLILIPNLFFKDSVKEAPTNPEFVSSFWAYFMFSHEAGYLKQNKTNK